MWADAETFYLGGLIGFILWLGFIAAPLLASYIYEGRPFELFAINSGYWLVGLFFTGGLLAVAFGLGFFDLRQGFDRGQVDDVHAGSGFAREADHQGDGVAFGFGRTLGEILRAFGVD